MIYGVRITTKGGTHFFATGFDGIFNTFSRKKAVEFKREMAAADVAPIRRMKVVPLIIKEGK